MGSTPIEEGGKVPWPGARSGKLRITAAKPWWSKRTLSVVIVPILLLITGIFVLIGTRAKPYSPTTNVAPSPGVLATATPALRLKGTTQAVQARAILAPLLAGQQVGTLTITKLAAAGTRVKRGDVLVEFDRQAQLRDFVDKQAENSDLNEKVVEEQAKEQSARAQDETAIKAAENDLSKAQLEMQKLDILSRIDAEKAQETLNETKATLAQLKETFDLKRKAAQASIRILEIQRERARESMVHAQANATLMQVHSPIDGIVVLNTIWKQGNMGEVQEGDQVRPGVPFMQVVDPSLMEVLASVNQEDLLGLDIGQKARIRLDAYPDLVFAGRLEAIDPMGKNGDFSSTLRKFAAVFSIVGNDPRLMPDLSSAVDVEPDEHDRAAGITR